MKQKQEIKSSCSVTSVLVTSSCVGADDSLNFGVSTLEEIRLRKALKASMKRAGYPSHSADGEDAE